jgi:antirepressor protein
VTDKVELIQDFPFEFYGEMYVTHLASDRQFYIRMKDVCDGMGLAPAAQRRRIQEDEGIAHYLVNIMADTLYQGGLRRKEVTFLNIRALPYWLGTIDAKRVKPEIYEKVVRFKRSFAETAWKVYRSDLMPPEVLAEMDTYEMPERAEIDGTMDQLRTLTKKLDKLAGRMDVIEARMGAEAIINNKPPKPCPAT